jgi:cytochrome c553
MKRILLSAAIAWIALVHPARAVDTVDAIPSAQLDSDRGKALFAQHCAACHEHPSGNIPPVFVLNYKSPEQIVEPLTKGPMRPQATGLTPDDIREIAIHLAHRAPGATHDPDPDANRCARPMAPPTLGRSSWNGVGGDVTNTRYQAEPR